MLQILFSQKASVIRADKRGKVLYLVEQNIKVPQFLRRQRIWLSLKDRRFCAIRLRRRTMRSACIASANGLCSNILDYTYPYGKSAINLADSSMQQLGRRSYPVVNNTHASEKGISQKLRSLHHHNGNDCRRRGGVQGYTHGLGQTRVRTSN